MSLDPSKYAPIPEELRTAFETGDVQTVLDFWEKTIRPMTQDTPRDHPHTYIAAYADAALYELIEGLLTPEQRDAPRFERAKVGVTYFDEEAAGVA